MPLPRLPLTRPSLPRWAWFTALALGLAVASVVSAIGVLQASNLAEDIHPNQTKVTVYGVNHSGGSTLVALEAVNNGPGLVHLNGTRESYLEDRSGRRYPLDPPPNNPSLTLEPGKRLRTELSFRGKPPAGEGQVMLVLNAGSAQPHGKDTADPFFNLRLAMPVRAGGEGPAGGRPAQAVAALQSHGVKLEVFSVEQSPRGIELTIAATNRSAHAVELNGNRRTVLRDDQGFQYLLIPPSDNPGLEVPARARTDTRLLFRGPLSMEAGRLFLVLNEQPSPAMAGPEGRPHLRLDLPLPQGLPAPDKAAGCPQGQAKESGGAGAEASGLVNLSTDELASRLGARDTGQGRAVTLLTDQIYAGKGPDGQRTQAMRPEALPRLAELAELIRRLKPKAVAVEGHTDGRGSQEFNQQLSLDRADALAQWLMAQPGLDKVGFAARGMGEGSPVADNGTAWGRLQNRRVEVVITADQGEG